jgi:hypothetical protein
MLLVVGGVILSPLALAAGIAAVIWTARLMGMPA